MNITLGYIDPVAFSLGPIQVRWYGIIIACGILLGYFIAQAALKQVGLHKDTLIDIIFYSAIVGFIVARIYFVTSVSNRRYCGTKYYFSSRDRTLGKLYES